MMVSVVLGVLLGAVLVLRAFSPEFVPIPAEVLIGIVAVYLIAAGTLVFLRAKKLSSVLSQSLREKNDIHEEFIEMKKELEQLGSIFREVKERERSLEQALSSLQSEYDAAKKQAHDHNGSVQILTFLSLLQEKGRFIDFISQDVTQYSDEHVGRVARFVHQGCTAVVRDHLKVEPVFAGMEGAAITLNANDFDPSLFRLSGSVPEKPPYQGTIRHRGWKVTKMSLPEVVSSDGKTVENSSAAVLAPAEVEILRAVPLI